MVGYPPGVGVTVPDGGVLVRVLVSESTVLVGKDSKVISTGVLISVATVDVVVGKDVAEGSIMAVGSEV